jgi:hypothetical protein
MAGRPPSALSRTVAAFRSFLRETWISRVDLALWLQGWVNGPSHRRHVPSKAKRAIALAIEGLEQRNPPDDPVGVLQSPWMGMAGTLLTPGVVLLKGWAAGQFADAGMQQDVPHVTHLSDTTAAAPPAPGPQAWLPTTSSGQSVADSTQALAPGVGAQSSAFQNALGGDPLQNALTDKWLNAIGNVLDSKRPDPVSVGGYPGGGGGGASGGGAPGSGPADSGVFAYSGTGVQSPAANAAGPNLASLAAFQGATAATSPAMAPVPLPEMIVSFAT